VSVLAVEDMKDYLNITEPDSDAELQEFIDAAEAAIAHRVGPLEPTAVTSRVGGGTAGLVLPRTPVASLTSITPIGEVALTIGDFDADPLTGIVGYTDGGLRFGSRSYTVVYEAGWDPLPADLLLAVKELVRHLWATQRGSGTRRPGAGAAEVPLAPREWPNRVLQLIAPYVLPGIA
jgi:hypothetical protein